MDNLQEQLARLHEQLQILLEDHVTPRWGDLVERLRGHRDTVSDHVCTRPLTAVLVAFGVGFMLGRAR